MAIVSSAKLYLDKKALATIDRNFKLGVLEMAYDIAARARANAPYITGALRNSIRVDQIEDRTAILVRAGGVVSSGEYGGKRIARKVDYAYKREIGPNRDHTTEHYMENAQKAVMTGDWQTQYFKGVTK